MTETQAEISSNSNNVIFSSPALRKTDENEDGLSCYSYDTCSETDSEFVKRCRGSVFDGDKLVFSSFGYTPEYTTNDADKIKNFLEKAVAFRVFDSHEGTIIRLFYYNKWYVSTHRKLDAFKSKWSSNKSFGEEFEDALSEYQETPDIASLTRCIQTRYGVENGKGYVFLLRNNSENRIVCKSPGKSKVYYVGTFYDNGNKFTVEDGFMIPTPKQHKNLISVEEIVEYVNSVDYMDRQGVIVFVDNNTQIKIYNSEYYDWYNVRGNEASVKFRYLQIRTNPILTTKLKILYPSFTNTFEEIESRINDITRYIHESYLSRFVSKKYTVVDQDSFRVIKECHSWHIADRKNNIVTIDQVMSVVNALPPSTLNRMIKVKN